MSDNINPMELLKEEMESDENSIRINAMHRIKTVATLLGPEGTKSQLLPYVDGKNIIFMFNMFFFFKVKKCIY